jgi:hypothetical protein
VLDFPLSLARSEWIDSQTAVDSHDSKNIFEGFVIVDISWVDAGEIIQGWNLGVRFSRVNRARVWIVDRSLDNYMGTFAGRRDMLAVQSMPCD